ncbi:MAG: carboxypeptidase-like regulatory domain-containing protein [Caldilineaceae bacterium]|nr:carboxypeptidase-like regulatory domain-containing protein [Caldilineaceae bacterium]
MELEAYPRPEDDTGIGVHWCAGVSAATPDMVEEFWLPELIALGVKWVKIAGQRNALHLVQTLLAARIMPVVEIVRGRPMPGPLSAAELNEVEKLIDAGARYFEFDSEPDRASLWPQEKLPPDAMEVTARAAVENMEAILARGGLPAIPALGPGSDWQLVEEIERIGGDALFDEPIWLAIHNYSSNRPPQYPEDPVHREGAPLSRELYLALAAEARREDPWQGRSLDEINELRRRLASKTEVTVASERDAAGNWRSKLSAALANVTRSQPAPPLPPHRMHWRAFEELNDQVQALVGRSLPILSTANGYRINENADPRYPATTPMLHMAQTLEICRAMMGTSRHSASPPDYYFCTAFWLLAHEALQGESSVDEQSAWYSPMHLEEEASEEANSGGPHGPDAFGWATLPIVPLLKAEPKRARAATGGEEREAEAEDEVTLSLSAPGNWLPPSGEGVISGKVRGGAEAQLRLTHSDGFAYESLTEMNGAFRFVELPAGRYSLEVFSPPGSRVDEIELAAGQKTGCELSVYGWGFEIEQRAVKHGRMLTCSVELPPRADPVRGQSAEDTAGGGRTGTPALRIGSSEQKSWVTQLARGAEGRTAHCEVGPLPSDSYRLEVLGLTQNGAGTAKGTGPVSCQAPINRGMVTDVRFVHSHDEKRTAPRQSSIAGTVDGEGVRIVRLRGAASGEQFAEADEEGHFLFSGLPAGAYSLDVKDRLLQSCPRPVALDGRNAARRELLLLPDCALPTRPEPALLQGQTLPGQTLPVAVAERSGDRQAAKERQAGQQPGQQVALLDARGQRYVTEVEPSGAFTFDGLPPGDYDLYAEGFERRGIHLDAGDRLSIQLARPAGEWSHHTRVRKAAEAPGLIRVQWLARPELTVVVEKTEDGEEARKTGGAEPPYCVEFGPFPPGVFRVHSPDLPVSAEVQLEAEEAAMVTFVLDTEAVQS